ncbi:hypothetical protein E3U43_011299 [Larimichthys crocea]|uniref:Uncharacterized protein n=1 Tax=Larimichthys crocea TaxID=215358 RepID=A0ACD3QIW1_LARCR|nr:hypothetical protein E3U43_011299 [Larimichthys crocea]
MYQGEEARLRSGSLAVARERKHLALFINNQDDVKRYHRYCNHSGGQAKVERGRPRRSEEEDDNSPHRREQQQHLEIKAIVIQRAWRASTSRRGSWQGQDKNHPGDHLGETVPSESLQDPVMTTNISPCDVNACIYMRASVRADFVAWILVIRSECDPLGCFGEFLFRHKPVIRAEVSRIKMKSFSAVPVIIKKLILPLGCSITNEMISVMDR